MPYLRNTGLRKSGRLRNPPDFKLKKKKEDLRQMVGERYRDLIEAADTIADMGRCAENEECTIWFLWHSISNQTASRHAREDLERNRRWETTTRNPAIFLSRHIVSSLQLDANTQKSAQLLSWFPILSRQWAAISHFKTSILQSCRSVLKDVKMSEQAIAEALCSILLLDDSSPRQVFTEFLLARKSAVQQFFHPYQPGIGIKSQVCGVIQLICTTVQHIYAVFYNSPDDTAAHCNLLLKIVEEVTDNSNKGHKKVLSKEMSSSSFAKYLPSSITEFHPVLNTLASPISAEYLQKSCQEWVDTCIQDINSGVGKLFTYLTTIKGLTGVRDALWELLGQENFEVKWKTICDCVLNRNLSPWDEFIRPLFLTRAQTIIQNMLDNTTDSTQKLIGQALDDIAFLNSECNVARYIWTESVSDTPPASVWSTPLVNRSPSDGGGLYMKSRAFTPRTQR
uniref:Conserved oligomeric Golgi complex subunit 1 n=1 Tax=Saccoglossus kowalevskii TaxID=10224 RepID=A0ABM0LUW5_SACKO|nr:PREDICTED: conserved oligomeric Golgi complex subunit 1-like [Saccoglossus kowalevskii]